MERYPKNTQKYKEDEPQTTREPKHLSTKSSSNF